MAEYIKREDALNLLWFFTYESCASVVPDFENLHAADVAEVRHGRWEFLGPNNLNRDCMCGTCSVCHVRSKYIVNTAICPNCGARMDKEDKHEAN